MIPENIKKNQILQAINKTDYEGVPKGRESRKYILKYRGKFYPSKYII